MGGPIKRVVALGLYPTLKSLGIFETLNLFTHILRPINSCPFINCKTGLFFVLENSRHFDASELVH